MEGLLRQRLSISSPLPLIPRKKFGPNSPPKVPNTLPLTSPATSDGRIIAPPSSGLSSKRPKNIVLLVFDLQQGTNGLCIFHAFRALRKLFKVDPADYMISICGNDALRELSSPGKSGSFFYLTNDDRYMIKTMKKAEVKVSFFSSFYILA